MAKTYSVFISHSWGHADDLKKLRNLLEERGYFHVEFNEASPDEPINSENSAYIKRRLKEKISNSDIVLGIAGMYASHSDWMEWELDTALEEKSSNSRSYSLGTRTNIKSSYRSFRRGCPLEYRKYC